MKVEQIRQKELKIIDLGMLGIDRKMTKKELKFLESLRTSFKQGKLTIEQAGKEFDKLRNEEDKRLNFKRVLK